MSGLSAGGGGPAPAACASLCPLSSSSVNSVLSSSLLPQKPKRHSRNCAAACFLLSDRYYLLSLPYTSTPQKSPAVPSNSNPNSQPRRPSCPRQIKVAFAAFPFIPFFTRNFCPTGNPCSTMARHPFGLTSTVYPFAFRIFPPSSHSTVNSTREFSRLPARICFFRDSSANSSVQATVVSLHSTPLAIHARCSARIQFQANKHTLLYQQTYPPLLPPSMELPLPFYQPVTPTPVSEPRSQAPHRVIPTGAAGFFLRAAVCPH
jgi:hypothetical protein